LFAIPPVCVIDIVVSSLDQGWFRK